MLPEVYEILGVDCRDFECHLVRLACSDSPPRLLEQLSLRGLADFEAYCKNLSKQSFSLYLVTEEHSTDPAGVLPWVEQYFAVDRQWVKPAAVAYLEIFERLGITHENRRAGALALNKAHQIQAKELTRRLSWGELDALRKQLGEIETQAARLYLALSSSIYSLSNNF